MKRIPIFAANWKMNKKRGDVAPYGETLSVDLEAIPGYSKAAAQVLVFPPAIYLDLLKQEATAGTFEVGAQHTGIKDFGAFTGEISPVQVADLGLSWALVGHSERRHVFHESDDEVAKRLTCALAHGLKAVFCIGETITERKAGKTWEVLNRQMAVLSTLKVATPDTLIVAYEPVWAIGTGETATAAQAEEAHGRIRQQLETIFGGEKASHMRILYGGSVKGDNAAELMAQPNVDGLLVGGASLDARAFAEIIKNGLGSAVSKR